VVTVDGILFGYSVVFGKEARHGERCLAQAWIVFAAARVCLFSWVLSICECFRRWLFSRHDFGHAIYVRYLAVGGRRGGINGGPSSSVS
jgi:hypothetical protein